MSGIKVTVGGDIKDGVEKIQSFKNKATSMAKEIKSAFTARIGQRMFDGLINAAGQVPAAIKDAINAASDMEETAAKVGVVFGESAGQMQAWAENAARSLGQSSQEALAGAASMGNLFTAMGLGAEKSAEMSRSIIELSSDLASFNNTSPEEAVNALSAALRGESEPIRKYGVLLDDATLKARALEMGLYAGKGALTPVQRAMAAYNEILAQTTTAQGDFARTADGLANSQRTISGIWKDAQAEIGASFLPLVQELADRIKEVDFEALADKIRAVVEALIAAAPAAMSVVKVLALIKAAKMAADLGQMALALGRNTIAFRQSAAAATAAATAQNAAGSAAKKMSGGFNVATIGLTALTVAVDMYVSKLEAGTKAMEDAVDAGNKANTDIDLGKITNSVKSPEEVRKELEKIENEIDGLIKKSNEIATSNADGDSKEIALDNINASIRGLEEKAKWVKNISAEQMRQNQAVYDAEQARIAEAAAIQNAANEYKNLKKEFDEAMDSAAKEAFEELPIESKIFELERKLKDARNKLNPHLKAMTAGEDGASIMGTIDKGGAHVDQATDAAAATEMVKIEQQLAKLRKDKATAEEDANQKRQAAAEGYAESLALLDAEIEGNNTKLKQLEREKRIREETAKLINDGFDPDKARKMAENLTSRQDDAAAARDKQKENEEKQKAIAKREESLIKAGLSKALASSISKSEDKTTAGLDLSSKMESATGQRTTVASSRASMGGGGGTYSAGLDYQRQIADYQRQLVALAKQQLTQGKERDPFDS